MTATRAQAVNCNAKHLYQADFKIPDTKGDLNTPTAPGMLSGVKLRFSRTNNGAALAAAVDNLTATELTTVIGRLQCELSQALQQAHLLALGKNEHYFGIWYKPGEFDMEYFEYIVADSHTP